MNIQEFVKPPPKPGGQITNEDLDALRRHTLAENNRRGRVFALLTIGFAACLILVRIGDTALKGFPFQWDLALTMYALMIVVNTGFYHLLKHTGLSIAVPDRRVVRQEWMITAYVTFMMGWGSAVSLMDQQQYGNLTAFMVNMVICSVTYSLPGARMLIPFAVSVVALAAGLTFCQPSADILLVHTVSLIIIASVSWIASRILYSKHIADYQNLLLLQKTNSQLEQEIVRNHRMNLQLADANRQLVKLSLLDELTGLPNRRGFRHFIDRMFEGQDVVGKPLSMLMIDLDHFKEYNDSLGHTRGDEVLQAVSAQIEAVVQHTTDCAARWGGEEFIYAGFGMGLPEIRAVAETMQNRVNALKIQRGEESSQEIVTVSIGTGTLTAHDKSDIAKCIDLADKALYQAKAEGRNRIVLLDGEPKKTG